VSDPAPEPRPADVDSAPPQPDLDGAHPPAEAEPPPPGPPCWRCGKPTDPTRTACHFCRAALGGPSGRRPEIGVETPELLRVLGGYAVLLGVSIAYALVLLTRKAGRTDPDDRDVDTAILEGIDVVLVLACWAWVGRVRQPRVRSLGVRLTAWLSVLPVLAAVLALNLGYHALLREYLDLPYWMRPHERLSWSPMTFVLITVQPAVIEELFFRHLALGSIRAVTGVHAAVWVSAAMFALAHVYVPLSVPLFVIVGAVLGYARVVSGGLALPILMHFAHNAAILYLLGQS
jgi:uncharacterized protein